METAQEALKTLGLSLAKYEKNRKMLSAEDLKGRYKSALSKLVKTIWDEAASYFQVHCIENRWVYAEDADDFEGDCERLWTALDIHARLKQALYADYSTDKVIEIASEYKKELDELFEKYYSKH